MDPVSPKLAPLPPSSPSKIPRRRPSSSSSSTSNAFNASFPSSPPSKVVQSSIPTSTSRSSNPWQPSSKSSISEQALQDRRRSRELSNASIRTQSRTRSRTQSTETDSTTFENPSSRKVPPLSIHIPHSNTQQRSTSSSSHPVTKQTIYSPSNSNLPFDPSSFTPRSRQPSQSHAHSLRTPRSAHFPSSSSTTHAHSQQPPMSERPRVPSSSHFSRSAPTTALPRDRDRERTNTSSHSTTLATPATYESFDFPLPTETTPREEREARLCLERRRNRCCGLGRLFYKPRGETSEWDDERDSGGGKGRATERTRLLGEDIDDGKEVGKWEYVWGEVVCYAKHMLPPIFLFVVLVLVIALFAYKQAIRRIIDDRFPPLTEEP